MTVIESGKNDTGQPQVDVAHDEGKEPESKSSEIFSEPGLQDESRVSAPEIGLGDDAPDIVVSPADKVAFIDSVVNNTRFTKEYSLFGGRLSLTVRSLTSDEVGALASWTVKAGSTDAEGMLVGRYRKYLAAAHVSMMDGVEMPPLEEPLYWRLGGDGKTIEPPGWLKRCDYWDSIGFAKFSAVMKCLQEFNALYSAMCSKAEDSNFWDPDTP